MRKKLIIAGASLLAGALVWLGFTLGTRTEWGNPVTVGNGEARAYVTLAVFGRPKEVGVRFTESTLVGLPSRDAETVLHFPESIKATPLTHFALNWNPHGHEPPGIYSAPHFDYHFYMISEQERAAIAAGTCTTGEDSLVPNPPGVVPVTCDVFDRAMEPLPADELPSGYTMVPSVLPNMGVHLVDMDSPEFKGESFTHTWIYGAYDGRLSFLEPMVSRDFLEKRADASASIPTPTAMPEAGWYPTAYSIRHDERFDAYFVTLESFRRFGASSGSSGQTLAAADAHSGIGDSPAYRIF